MLTTHLVAVIEELDDVVHEVAPVKQPHPLLDLPPAAQPALDLYFVVDGGGMDAVLNEAVEAGVQVVLGRQRDQRPFVNLDHVSQGGALDEGLDLLQLGARGGGGYGLGVPGAQARHGHPIVF